MIHSKSIAVWSMIAIILLFSACKGDEGPKPSAVHSVDAWSIQILRWEAAARLNATRAVEHYNGTQETVVHEEKPKEGYVFLLVELKLEKKDSGNAIFDWERLYLEDAKGVRHKRHPNDSFLTIYRLPRIKAVPLTFGNNTGYICFEIPEATSKNALTLVYNGIERLIRIPLAS